jgi:hypothetical protein
MFYSTWTSIFIHSSRSLQALEAHAATNCLVEPIKEAEVCVVPSVAKSL